MNTLTVFNNEQFGEIRTVSINGEPWIVAVDVCRALEISNSRMATDRLDEDEKATVSLTDTSSNGVSQNREMTVINEYGLYSLILGSRKPEAKAFKRWVTHEVIPSIRRTGSYAASGINSTPDYANELAAYKFIGDDLHLNDASKMLMYETYCKERGLPTGCLPHYELNGNRKLCSLSELLKVKGSEMSAVKFNVLLMGAGIIEERTRPSSKYKDKIRKFKALTEKGLKYGENTVSAHNQREVQPLYFEDSFDELYELAVS